MQNPHNNRARNQYFRREPKHECLKPSVLTVLGLLNREQQDVKEHECVGDGDDHVEEYHRFPVFTLFLPQNVRFLTLFFS